MIFYKRQTAKNLTCFLQCKHVALLHDENNAEVKFFIAFVLTFFYKLGIERKKLAELGNETLRKVCGKSIEICKNLHDHAKQRRVTCLFNFCSGPNNPPTNRQITST